MVDFRVEVPQEEEFNVEVEWSNPEARWTLSEKEYGSPEWIQGMPVTPKSYHALRNFFLIPKHVPAGQIDILPPEQLVHLAQTTGETGIAGHACPDCGDHYVIQRMGEDGLWRDYGRTCDYRWKRGSVSTHVRNLNRLRSAPDTPPSIAIVSGYFNPLHIGHLRLIHQASHLGDEVVVIVNNDRQQLQKKRKIIMIETHRLAIISQLKLVDAALIATDEGAHVTDSLRYVRELFPKSRLIFCNGGDRSSDEALPSDEVRYCLEAGIEVHYGIGGFDKADSSSAIQERMNATQGPRKTTQG